MECVAEQVECQTPRSKQFPLEQIKIMPRVRKDLGDIESLMESLQNYGLLNPIVVNHQDELIAGHRRLESARRLGWTYIDVSILNKSTEVEKLQLEIEENLHRQPFHQDELEAALTRLKELNQKSFFQRLWQKLTAWINEWTASRD